ncbi:MAG: membrane protein insertion efficiency factor YidD [Lactobacillus sp.]|nr:membrane protein insertion efficiency factor YidD [Lactobacillus sp.]
MVKFYQKAISPILPNVCRYQPSCSQYMIDAITTHGVIKGIYLGSKRILRCQPWGGSGYDPVPPAKDKLNSCQCAKHEVKDIKHKK